MRECKNQMTIIGKLKSKEVKTGITKAGDAFIAVDLTIVSEDNGKIHENIVGLWAKETSKLAKGYHTVVNEYKTIDEHGEEAADRIKVTGNITMNEYVNKDGEMKTFNNLKGVFVERVTTPEVKDEAGVVLECIVLGYSAEIEKDGKPTGRDNVIVYTIGYQNSIHELKNVKVSAELSQQFKRLYTPNSTGRLFIKINNYAEILEKEEVQEVQAIGFGAQLENMPDKVAKNYVNELLIVGGDMPLVTNKFSMEELTEMRKIRTLAQQEKLSVAPIPQTTSAPNGFGSEMIDNSIPQDDLPF